MSQTHTLIAFLADYFFYRSFYLGKKVAFVYRAHREIRGSKIRVIWGKITRPHGTQHSTPPNQMNFANKDEQATLA